MCYSNKSYSTINAGVTGGYGDMLLPTYIFGWGSGFKVL